MYSAKSLLLPALLGAAHAASDNANVYILSKSNVGASTLAPALSSIEARLVIAQRLGVSQYSDLHEASDDALAYVNTFGGAQQPLFSEHIEAQPKQLVVVVEGCTDTVKNGLESAWGALRENFQISNPASAAANAKLVDDLNAQIGGKPASKKCSFADEFNPFKNDCWTGSNKVVHVESEQSAAFLDKDLQATLHSYITSEVLDIVLVTMPTSSLKAKSGGNPYGAYEMPSAIHRRQFEAPIREFQAPKSKVVSSSGSDSELNTVASNFTALKGIIPFCHASLDACISATNNCSGHGECYKKYQSKDKQSTCFSCACIPTWNEKTSTYWGGAACSKIDVSSQFWLIASFVVVLTGLISWAIGMMFSIGEEKLPGVIGAGVTGPTAGGGR